MTPGPFKHGSAQGLWSAVTRSKAPIIVKWTIRRLLTVLIVWIASSCTVRTAALQPQFDKRLERLDREREKLKRPGDPVDRAKIDINISEILLSLVSDAVKTGEPEVVGRRLNEYIETIQDAHQTMMKTGRDAHRKPKGFKELEIALRRQTRVLEDLSRSVTFDQREPVDKAKQEASDIREEVLKALFGEQNVSGRKG